MLPRIMILSDIHGGYFDLNQALSIYERENYERLFVLGDLFGWPYGETDEKILERIKGIPDSVIVRGNCDPEIYGIEETVRLTIGDLRITLTHGHRCNLMQQLGLNSDIICSGHTHIPSIREYAGRYLLNPGSVARSRQGPNSFAAIEDGYIRVKSIQNEILDEMKLRGMKSLE